MQTGVLAAGDPSAGVIGIVLESLNGPIDLLLQANSPDGLTYGDTLHTSDDPSLFDPLGLRIIWLG
jgi:hypothetical protein